MIHSRILRCCLPLVLLAAACNRTPPAASSDQPLDLGVALTALEVPAPRGSAHPQLTSSAKGAILSWLDQDEATTTLRFSERAGGVWSEPRTVSTGMDWFITAADVPSVLRMKNGTLVANWYPTTDETIEAYDTYLSYSRDEGRTWAKAFSPHHDGTKTQHGFVSLLELADGGLGMVWLDGRDQEQNTTDPLGGSMALYFASFDSSWKQSAEAVVNARVCECCQTAVVVTTDGLLTAFRDRTAEEIRDVKVSRLEGGKWSTEVSLHDDNWKIEACPINGPALSARGRQVAAAWFAAPNDNGRAFVAFSEDAGKSWGKPIRLDDEASLGRVDIEMLDDGSAVASWVEFANGRSQFKVRRVAASGQRSEAAAVPGAGRVSGYPRMTRSGDELVLAWTEGEAGQQVKAAVARVQ
jgi:BNR repeat-like domain